MTKNGRMDRTENIFTNNKQPCKWMGNTHNKPVEEAFRAQSSGMVGHFCVNKWPRLAGEHSRSFSLSLSHGNADSANGQICQHSQMNISRFIFGSTVANEIGLSVRRACVCVWRFELPSMDILIFCHSQYSFMFSTNIVGPTKWANIFNCCRHAKTRFQMIPKRWTNIYQIHLLSMHICDRKHTQMSHFCCCWSWGRKCHWQTHCCFGVIERTHRTALGCLHRRTVYGWNARAHVYYLQMMKRLEKKKKPSIAMCQFPPLRKWKYKRVRSIVTNMRNASTPSMLLPYTARISSWPSCEFSSVSRNV